MKPHSEVDELGDWMSLVIFLGFERINFLCLASGGHRVLEEKHVKCKVKKKRNDQNKIQNIFPEQRAESLSQFRNQEM